MTAKAPVEKLPLAVRKNVRDEFENKRGELEEKLSKLLGEPWNIEANPNLIYAYAEEGSYGANSLGSCLHNYFESAIDRIKYFLESQGHGSEGAKEINTLCPKHVMTIYPDTKKRFTYCGSDIDDGTLRIIFQENNLGCNIYEALAELEKTLDQTSFAHAPESLSYTVRHSIKQDWETKSQDLQEKIGEQVHNPNIKLTPQFEQIYKAMKASKDVDSGWESRVGSIAEYYYESVKDSLAYNKFKDDDMLYEGFGEAITKGEITLRVVDKLTGDSSYNQLLIEEGVLVMQTVPRYYGTNTNDIARTIVDIL